jgi:hypothetical protein
MLVFLFRASKDPNSKDLKNSRGEEPGDDPVGDPQNLLAYEAPEAI